MQDLIALLFPIALGLAFVWKAHCIWRGCRVPRSMITPRNHGDRDG